MVLNGFNSKMAKFQKIRFSIILILIGLIFAFFGGLIAYKNINKNIEYIKTEATITSIEDGYSDNEYNVFFEFNIDENNYSNNLIINKSNTLYIGGKIDIYYDLSNPNNVSTNPKMNNALIIVVLIIGIILFFVGIITLIINIKTKSKDLDQFNRVDIDNISDEMIESVKNSNEETREYYFHFCGKMNQSYVLETPERETIINMECLKFNPFKPYQFKFTNKLNLTVNNYTVSHTVTYSMGSSGWSFPVKSTFKLNGENVFDVIAKNGYSINAKVEGLRLNFDIFKYGVKVASLNMGGANIAKANKSYGKMGNIPTNGVYSVFARESDLDMVALIAFSVSRVEFF